MRTNVPSTFAGQDGAHRMPPHNIEAEQSVLGAMLLSEASISDVLETLRPDDFYKPAHRRVFEAMLGLFGRGEAVDPVTVSEELRRAGKLEEAGGKAYLFTLVNSVPAASNASYYGRIVEETALLRRLIEATQEAAAMAFDSGDDVDHIIDSVEQLIFSVAERRLGDRFSHIRDLLHEHMEQVEALQLRGSGLTGVPTGFVDLDRLTSGLQPSNLVIVAARPSFGKTSLALNIAQHAAGEHGVPTAIFSLEMSKLELVQRLVCSEALVDVHKLRTGHLSDQDWSRLSNAVGRLAEAPIFIDDTEAVTVLEIRAKARRLKQKSGLGLVIVDYLQLMAGPRRSENRQQEISEISRSLKILARELGVPVIAASQLSRNVEYRSDKRPMLADLRESGCLTADTRVLRADTGEEETLGDLFGRGARDVPVWTFSDDLKLVRGVMTHVFPSGTKDVFRMRLRSGREVKASANHPFRTPEGWRRLDALHHGGRVAVVGLLEQQGRTPDLRDSQTAVDGQMSATALLHETVGTRERAVLWDEVVSIEPLGEMPVYDATVLHTHNFIANGIVVHNSIEQDSDVVMFIYRDEVYNADSPDKGTAEVLVAKHRNGPVGSLKLTFLPNYTKFANHSSM